MLVAVVLYTMWHCVQHDWYALHAHAARTHVMSHTTKHHQTDITTHILSPHPIPQEITRRVNLCDIWQAAYTAGVHIPTPVASCQYWHRSINPKKLISVGFSRLQSRMTLARTIKLYKLPPLPSTPGLRPMRVSDVPQVAELLNTYLAKYKLAPVMNQEEVAHWLLPVPDVVNTFVADQGGRVSDLISFYTLPSTVLGNAEYDSLKVGCGWRGEELWGIVMGESWCCVCVCVCGGGRMVQKGGEWWECVSVGGEGWMVQGGGGVVVG